MATIKGVFFDLGGTLRIAETVPEHIEAAKQRMAELVGASDVQGFNDLVEERYAPYRDWALSECRECGDFALWHNWLLPEMEEDRLRSICHELTFQYRQTKGKRHLVEGGLEVIETLHARGYKLGIISNLVGENEIPDWLRDDGLDKYFDALVLSSVCGLRKPDPRLFEIALNQAGLSPGEVWFCGDSMRADVMGAHGAGIFPVLYEGFADADNPAPDPGFPMLRIGDWRELIELLKQMEAGPT